MNWEKAYSFLINRNCKVAGALQCCKECPRGRLIVYSSERMFEYAQRKGLWFVSDVDTVHQLSPSQVSVEEDGSTDSFLASEDINDAYSLVQDKNLISRALETVAKVSTIWSPELLLYAWYIKDDGSYDSFILDC